MQPRFAQQTGPNQNEHAGGGTAKLSGFRVDPARQARFPGLGEVCRLGLASRGNTRLGADGVATAIAHGVNYLNWCGYADGLSRAVRRLGDRRRQVIVAAQFSARRGREAAQELHALLGELGTDYIDALTYYYVEHPDEWEEIVAPGGAAQLLEQAKAQGIVRAIGLTSHQRTLAAQIAGSGRLDFLMIRYNAAHRGAEADIFPVARARNLPIVAFTALRWGALLATTAEDPPRFEPPPAAAWYRFVLCCPDVTVALMAPGDERELAENLTLLDAWRGLSLEEYQSLAAHGDRVRRHAGSFP
jgi:predicted aldo/keto reductase-like oxidoreductase